MTATQQDKDETGATIWVRSDVTPDGIYTAAIHFSDDRSRVLDHDAGMRYVHAVVAAAARAEHDAAVVRQLTSLGLPRQAVGEAVQSLREDRPPLDHTATAPLRLEPGVSGQTGEAFITVIIDDKPVGQWTADDARSHAVGVLEVFTAVDLDAAYRRYLVATVGLDLPTATAVVTGLGEHM
ncbi:hypothetical protein ACQEVF_56940 [Nonomuraea polychroma]|uniref:hypothetical protein n=1 Tax=Nonomuraea polychroma TaxID=46176 RepID=UPI003D8A428A